MKKSICLLLALLTLCGCSSTSTTMTSSQSETAQIAKTSFPAGTATQEDCRFCGSNSKWNHYRKLDSIGIMNLSNAQITDLAIFEYEDDGSLRNNSGYSTLRNNGDDDGNSVLLRTMGERGLCNLSLLWKKDKLLDLNAIAPLYCTDCMEKITAIDEDFPDALAKKWRAPFAMIDFTDGQLYSLNGISTPYFIRDYYMNFEFEENRIDGVVVYAPERIFK